MITLILDWPDKALSPNSRAKWAKIAAVKQARADAYLLAKEAGVQMRPGLVRMSLTFYPPDGRLYDLDGLGSRCKAAIDGVFQALELNDHCVVELRYIRGQICREGKGSVQMIIVEANP
jgi:hypothetical protein